MVVRMKKIKYDNKEIEIPDELPKGYKEFDLTYLPKDDEKDMLEDTIQINQEEIKEEIEDE